MTSVFVEASSSYQVKIGQNLLASLGEEAKNATSAKTIVIVSDSIVYPLYGKIAQNSLENAGFCVSVFVFDAGEGSKNGETYLRLLNFLAQSHITRTDCLVVLGGGVVGDLCGFAAATYLRGIDFIQVPTTLLAMVDSSIGGKTAINLEAGKNLAGAFHQPILVLCDTSLLESLPNQVLLNGCGEVIKTAVLFDSEMFAHLMENGAEFDQEWVISRCISHKRDIVQQDEFDKGVRQLLNFGHTFGHSIEKASNFTLSHGRAVAIGMAMATRCALKNQICTLDTAKRILALIGKFSLPTSSEYSPEVLAQYALSDKKRASKEIALVLPATIGCCLLHKVPVSNLLSYFEAGCL